MIEKVCRKNIEYFEALVNNLWSNTTFKQLKKDAKKTSQFIYKLKDKYVGFITCSLKKEYVIGCKTNKVAYLEGLYVLPEYRRKGIAKELEEHFEQWAKKLGCKELASDLEIDNKASLDFHSKMGYDIVEKTIHLKKEIKK